jgi:hypothetical protein
MENEERWRIQQLVAAAKYAAEKPLTDSNKWSHFASRGVSETDRF